MFDITCVYIRSVCQYRKGIQSKITIGVTVRVNHDLVHCCNSYRHDILIYCEVKKGCVVYPVSLLRFINIFLFRFVS